MNRAGLIVVILALFLAVASAWMPQPAEAQWQADHTESVTLVAPSEL
jgi:hypothetical protein